MADDDDDEFFDLIHRAREGSEEAAQELVEKYLPSIRRASGEYVTRVFAPSSTRWTLHRSCCARSFAIQTT